MPNIVAARCRVLVTIAFTFLGGCSKDHGVRSRNDDDGGSVAAERIYVTSTGTDQVQVVDASDGEVKERIPVGAFPAILLATPDHRKLYSANWDDDSLSAIDVGTSEVTRVALRGKPWVEAMSPDGRYVYAGLGTNEIAVIATATDTVDRSLSFDTLPASIAVSPDAQTLYVAKLSDSTLEAITPDGDVVHPPIKVGSAPAWITITPDGGTVYTLNFVTGDVTAVDTGRWEIAATISLGTDSAGIVGNVSPDGSVLCVTDYGTLDVSAVDTQKNERAWKLETEGRPVGIGFSPDGKRGYAGDYGEASLAVTPSDLIAALASNTSLRATSPGTITVFDPATGKKTGAPITVDPGPASIVVLPSR